MSYKPPIIASFITFLFFFVGCSSDQQSFYGMEDLSPDELQTDTLQIFYPTIKDPAVADSVTAFIIIRYPKRTKEVIWYSIGYMPGGSGQLSLTTFDDSTYTVKLKRTDVVAATGSLMYAAHIRYDTVTTELYSYKSSGSLTLKQF